MSLNGLPNYDIPTFSGIAADFKSWQEEVMIIAERAGSYGPHATGLVGEIISPAAYHVFLHGRGLPNALYRAPEAPDGAIPNQLSLRPDAWFQLEQRYIRHRTELNIFKSKLLGSLPPSAISQLKYGNVYESPIHVVWQHLITLYGELSRADISNILSRLSVPYQLGTSLDNYCISHMDVYIELQKNGHVSTEFEKVENLLRMLPKEPIFVSLLQSFYTIYPVLAQQTFSNLIRHLESYDANFSSAFQSNYAATTTATAAAVTTITLDSLMMELKGLKEELEKCKKSKSKKKQPNSAEPRPPPTKTCWTHGLCHHTSAECRSPGQGHIIDHPTTSPSHSKGGSNKTG